MSGTTLIAVVSRPPQGPGDHDESLSYSVLRQTTTEAADQPGLVALLPVARVGVVNLGKGVVDHDAQGGEQG